jgi:hypothetical protein
VDETHARHGVSTHGEQSLNRLAASATTHCLAGWPVNRWLIARGRGHAIMHEYHGH